VDFAITAPSGEDQKEEERKKKKKRSFYITLPTPLPTGIEAHE